MAAHNSPQSKCATCFRFIPSWDLHLKCVAHWDRDCSRASPCDVCQVWSASQWDYVDHTVAREEAKAFLKARGAKPGKRPKISPTDVSGGRPKRPKSDISLPITNTMSNVVNPASADIVSDSSIHRSPETRRRAEALKFARESTPGVDSRSLLSPGPNSAGGVGVIGDNVVLTTPTQEISGDFANKIALANSSGSGRATGRKPVSAGVLSVVTIPPRTNAGYSGRNDVSGRSTEPLGSGISQPLDDVARNQGSTCPDGGLGEQPSSGHGHEGPLASSPVEVSVPAGSGNSMHGSSGQPCPGQPGPSQSQPGFTATALPGQGNSHRGFPSPVIGITNNLVQARVEWQAAQQQPPRTGGFILNCNRRSRAVATVTRPVPWTGEYTQAIDQVYGSPIVTPGHMGYHANALNLEVPLDVAHLSDLEAQPRPFRTPSTDSHAMLPPPGFAVPLTPRERWPGPAILRNCRLP